MRNFTLWSDIRGFRRSWPKSFWPGPGQVLVSSDWGPIQEERSPLVARVYQPVDYEAAHAEGSDRWLLDHAVLTVPESGTVIMDRDGVPRFIARTAADAANVVEILNTGKNVFGRAKRGGYSRH